MQTNSIFSREYWKDALKQMGSAKMLAFAGIVCALRIAVKALKIQLAPGLSLTFDCYVNSLGSLVYGPIVGLLVGAISDSIGFIVFPSASGPYFLPFMFVEMSSSFVFALFLWKRKVTVPRVLLAKFTVNFICNIILTSLFMKWEYAWFHIEKVYYFVNAARIVKNLVLFPFEGVLIAIILNAVLPGLKATRFVEEDQNGITLTKKDILLAVGLFLLSVAIILFYVFFLKDFIDSHNVKFW